MKYLTFSPLNHWSKSVFSLYVPLLEASLLQKQMIHYITLKSTKSFLSLIYLNCAFILVGSEVIFVHNFEAFHEAKGLQSFLPSRVIVVWMIKY